MAAGAQPARQRRPAGLELHGGEPRPAAAGAVEDDLLVVGRDLAVAGHRRERQPPRSRPDRGVDGPAAALRVELEAAARLPGQSKRASVFGSAQFSRPPWIDGSESTAMNGTTASGPRVPASRARRGEHLVVGPDRRLAVADQRADRDREPRRPRSAAGSRSAAPGAARWNHTTASSTVAQGAGDDSCGRRAASSSASADSSTPSISWSACTSAHLRARRGAAPPARWQAPRASLVTRRAVTAWLVGGGGVACRLARVASEAAVCAG